MPNYDHCLRPVFTERLVNMLQRGKSINLIGYEGTGRRRQLEDIQTSKLPNTKTAVVNMKSYSASYNGFIKDLWAQFGGQEESPADLRDLLKREATKGKQLFLLLHNFDALLDNSRNDPKYNIAFYDTLNNLRSRPNVSLVCVTKTAHNHSFIFIDGKPYRSSWLDLEQIALPALKHEEVIYEVKRRKLPVTRKQRNAMIKMVRMHKTPYLLLEFLTNKIFNHEDRELPFPERLKKWEKAFKHARPHVKSTFIITIIGRLEGWVQFLRLDTKRVNVLWKVILGALVFLLSIVGVEKSGIGKVILDFLQGLGK